MCPAGFILTPLRLKAAYRRLELPSLRAFAVARRWTGASPFSKTFLTPARTRFGENTGGAPADGETKTQGERSIDPGFHPDQYQAIMPRPVSQFHLKASAAMALNASLKASIFSCPICQN